MRLAATCAGILFLLCSLAAGGAPERADARQYVEDFDAMWRAIDEGYAYFDQGRGAWRRTRQAWRPRAGRARTRAQFVSILEGALAELRDDHVSLSERNPASPRRIPADTDIWATWKERSAVVEAVRTYGDADVVGLRPGHEIVRIAGAPVDKAIAAWLGGAAPASRAARDWALRHVLAGPRAGVLRVEVAEGPTTRTVEIERRSVPLANGPALIARRVGDERDLGYIRIKEELDDAKLPQQFDGALNYLQNTRALILDLRELSDTVSRASTLAILGRFVAAPTLWQVRETPGKPRRSDVVKPRGAPYRAPLVVLVDRWTAGEGEALAAGLQGAAGARLIGTRMAGMRGELKEVKLPHSGLAVRFPAQKVFLVDGTPREALRPAVEVNLAAPDGGPGDPILYQALKLLEK